MANQFVPFGLSPGPGYVLSPVAWAASTVRTTGYGPGLLAKENLNTAMRQSSSIATMVANFIAANQAADVNDDGNLVVLLAQFQAALAAVGGALTVVTISGTDGQVKFPGLAGLTLKWGYTPVYGLDSSAVFSFPALGAVPGPFPNTCFGVVITAATDNGVGTGANYSAGAHTPTPSGFTVSNDSQPSKFFYFAIGN